MDARKKKSIIWSISKEEMQELLNFKESFSDIMRHFKLNPRNGSVKTLYRRIKEDDLDDSILRNKTHSLSMYNVARKKSNEQVFTENSSFSRKGLKERLIQQNLLPYLCLECGNAGEWNGKKLSLQLEHKNGINDDNRIENLGFLCPNCHSQTDTYAGKNAKRPISPSALEKKERKLRGPNRHPRTTKIVWPTKEYFEKALWERPTTHIAKELGVSDKAVEKYIKKLNLTKPPRGYWKKFQ